jgi:hypothetical protein
MYMLLLKLMTFFFNNMDDIDQQMTTNTVFHERLKVLLLHCSRD